MKYNQSGLLKYIDNLLKFNLLTSCKTQLKYRFTLYIIGHRCTKIL